MQNKISKTIKIKIDPELYSRIQKEAKKLDINIAQYVKWCIETGIYLDDLNEFVRAQTENS